MNKYNDRPRRWNNGCIYNLVWTFFHTRIENTSLEVRARIWALLQTTPALKFLTPYANMEIQQGPYLFQMPNIAHPNRHGYICRLVLAASEFAGHKTLIYS
jgi:hypothetical protein